MNKALILSVLLAVAVAGSVYFMYKHKAQQTDYKKLFKQWKMDNGISFGTNTEEDYRLWVFTNNAKTMEAWNADPNNTSKLGLNMFSALTQAEHRAQNCGYKHNLQARLKKPTILSEENLAESMDWRDRGAVTPVKNQGHCGSCWSFSATGALEGAHWVAENELLVLSEQQLVDCDTLQDNGCHGGLMDNAFEFAKEHAIVTEDEYPYRATDGHTCQNRNFDHGVSVEAIHDVQPDSASQLRAALNVGPVSVAIEADQMVFQGYTTGVITSSRCGTQLDHGVLAVGYGNEDGEDYFLVKNSWGEGWGDAGYVKVGANNICGILSAPSYPTTN